MKRTELIRTKLNYTDYKQINRSQFVTYLKQSQTIKIPKLNADRHEKLLLDQKKRLLPFLKGSIRNLEKISGYFQKNKLNFFKK